MTDIFTVPPVTWTIDTPMCNPNTFNLEIRDKFNNIVTNVVDKTTAETLTNKTLTSPVINAPTGIVKADVGLGNVDNTSDATKNAAAVTLANKTLISPVITGLFEWVDFVPMGSGAILSGYETAKYAIVGKICFIHFYAYNRSLSGAPNPITMFLPFDSILNAMFSTALIYNGTAWDHVQVGIGLNGNAISIFKTLAGGNWLANETNLIIGFNVFYGIA